MPNTGRNLFENITVKNLICRVNVCAPDWGEKDCVYGYHKFYYFLEGEGTLVIQGDEYHPQPGELFMIPANTIHSYRHNPQKPVYKYWCHFDFTMNRGQKLVYSRKGAKCTPPKELVITAFKRLVNKDVSRNPLDTLMERSALLDILFMFLEHVGLENAVYCGDDEFVNRINQYIVRNIRDSITLKQLADTIHLHPNYFIKFFRKHFFISPIEYVNIVRLETAAQLLLREPGKKIGDIAYEAGFQDYRYFCRLFRKKYGITPSAYKDGSVNKQS